MDIKELLGDLGKEDDVDKAIIYMYKKGYSLDVISQTNNKSIHYIINTVYATVSGK